MATTYNNVQLGVVDGSYNVNVLYPLLTAEDVSVKKLSNGNISTDTLQNICDSLGDISTNDGYNLIYIGEMEATPGVIMKISDIRDEYINDRKTWSSDRISKLFPVIYKDNREYDPYNQNYDNRNMSTTISDIDSLFDVPTVFSFDDKLVNKYKGDKPVVDKGYVHNYIVEYYPLMISNKKTVDIAYQEWTVMSSSDESSIAFKFFRWFHNNRWHGFNTLRY